MATRAVTSACSAGRWITGNRAYGSLFLPGTTTTHATASGCSWFEARFIRLKRSTLTIDCTISIGSEEELRTASLWTRPLTICIHIQKRAPVSRLSSTFVLTPTTGSPAAASCLFWVGTQTERHAADRAHLLLWGPKCCCCSSCRWDDTLSPFCGHQQFYCSCPRWYMSKESSGGMILAG